MFVCRNPDLEIKLIESNFKKNKNLNSSSQWNLDEEDHLIARITFMFFNLLES